MGADVVVDSALAFLRSRRGLPTFLYVHTMDPHVPYAPPAPFDRMFEPLPTAEHPARDPRTDYKEPLDRERMIAQYDGDIAFGDREFGRFVRELKAAGLYDDALVVFLADHGEEFLDHGRWLHGRSLFDELVRVPLVVKFPGNRGAGRRVAEQVQGLDVVPTVLEAHGRAARPATSAGGRCSGRWPRAGRSRAPRSPRSPTAASWPTGCARRATSTSAASAPTTTSSTSTSRRDPGEQASVAGQNPAARAPPPGAGRGGHGAEPVPLRGAGRRRGPLRARLETRGWLEGVEATGLGPRERSSAGRQRALARPAPAAAPRRAARDRLHRAPGGGAGHARRARATAGPCGRRTSRWARASFRPEAFPFRLPDIESETETRPRPRLFAAPRRGRVRRAGLARPAPGPLAPGAGRRDARAAEGARLRRARVARWPGSSSSTSTARSSTPRATSPPPRTRRSRRVAPGTRRDPARRRSSRSSARARGSSSSAASATPGSTLPPTRCCPSSSTATRERLLDTTRLYPGVAEALDALAGPTLAVLTNKPGRLQPDDPRGPRRRPPLRADLGRGRRARPQARPGGPPAPDGRARRDGRARPGWWATRRPTSAPARAAGVQGGGRHLGLRPAGAAGGRPGPAPRIDPRELAARSPAPDPRPALCYASPRPSS